MTRSKPQRLTIRQAISMSAANRNMAFYLVIARGIRLFCIGATPIEIAMDLFPPLWGVDLADSGGQVVTALIVATLFVKLRRYRRMPIEDPERYAEVYKVWATKKGYAVAA